MLRNNVIKFFDKQPFKKDNYLEKIEKIHQHRKHP